MQVWSPAHLTARLQPGRGVPCGSGTREPGRAYDGCFAFCGKTPEVHIQAPGSLFLTTNSTCGRCRRHFCSRRLPEHLGELLTTGTLEAGGFSPPGNTSRAERLGADH